MRHQNFLSCLLVPSLLLSAGCSGPEDANSEAALQSAPPVHAPCWHQLGGNLNPTPTSYVSAPALAVQGQHAPVLALSSPDPQTLEDTTRVLRWLGSQWQPVGPPLAHAFPRVVMDATGRLFVCAGRGPFVWRWTGARWAPLGGDISTETGYRTSRFGVDGCGGIVLSSSGEPIVTWTADQGAKVNFVYAARFSATRQRWEGLNGMVPSGRSGAVSLAIDDQDRPYVATYSAGGSYGGGNTTQAFRFDSPTWTALGPAMPDTEGPTLAVSGSRVFLALQARATGVISVLRWQGSEWSSLPSPGLGIPGALAVLDSGQPLLTYFEGAEPTVIRLKAFTGAAWDEAGVVAAVDDPYPGLALVRDGRGRPIVGIQSRSPSGTFYSVTIQRYSGAFPD